MDLTKGMHVRERLNNMANSHEILIMHFFQKKNINFKSNWSFNKKIILFEKESKSILEELDMKNLIKNLYDLNEDWTFVKHGMHIPNYESKVLFIKDGITREFDNDYMNNIEKRFSDDQVKLCKIVNSL